MLGLTSLLLLSTIFTSAALASNTIPSCSTNCPTLAFTSQLSRPSPGSTACSNPTDFSCLCQNPDYLIAIAGCYNLNCNLADANSSWTNGASATCLSHGISIQTFQDWVVLASPTASPSPAANSNNNNTTTPLKTRIIIISIAAGTVVLSVLLCGTSIYCCRRHERRNRRRQAKITENLNSFKPEYHGGMARFTRMFHTGNITVSDGNGDGADDTEYPYPPPPAITTTTKGNPSVPRVVVESVDRDDIGGGRGEAGYNGYRGLETSEAERLRFMNRSPLPGQFYGRGPPRSFV